MGTMKHTCEFALIIRPCQAWCMPELHARPGVVYCEWNSAPKPRDAPKRCNAWMSFIIFMHHLPIALAAQLPNRRQVDCWLR